MLAELLHLPQLTFATTLQVEDRRVKVHRQTADGHQVVEAEAPALVSVTAAIAEPRYASLKGIMAARRKEVKEVSFADLGIEKGSAGGGDRRRRRRRGAERPARSSRTTAPRAWTGSSGSWPRPR